MPKDMQRTKIQRAQASITAPPLDSPTVQRMVSKVLSSRWWGTRRPDVRALTVQFGWDDCTVRPTATRICLAGPPKPTYLTIMHALAHWLQPEGSVAHGHEFALAYVHLVTRFIGDSAGKNLRAAFRAEKVKTSTWSHEARAAAQDRSLSKRFAQAGEEARALVARLAAEDSEE